EHGAHRFVPSASPAAASLARYGPAFYQGLRLPLCRGRASHRPGAIMTKPLSEAARQALAGVSTATLTTQLFKRGLRNTFVQGARPLNPNAPAMVGPAYTLRYIPAREDIDT